MTARSSYLLFLALMLLNAPSATAQAQTRVVAIETNHGDSNVFVDQVWLGRASQEPFTVAANARTLSITAPGLDAWSIDPIRVDLSGSEADTVRVDAHFPYHYKVETVPLAVDVFHLVNGQRTLLGEAPLLFVSDSALSGVLSLEKDGYAPRQIEPDERIWNRYLIQLEPRTDVTAAGPDVSLATTSTKRRRWIDVAALGSAALAGVLAVHYRTKADSRFSEWKETNDPALKDDIRRLDLYSGVALGTMQVGLGVFAIRLAF